jgi:hypothetical protein
MRRLVGYGLATFALIGACSADRPDTGHVPDAAMGSALEAPSLDPGIPMSTPNATVAVRGTTSGARVLVEGGPGNPTVNAVLPTGGFCVDAPLNASGPTILTAFALKDGLVSPPSNLTVTQDASAPQPSAPTCLGMEQPTCVAEDTAAGNCSNGIDDDCDGYTDACDPGCNGCVDDAFGPNWEPFFVPMIAAGTYNLQLCPCRSDWFSWQANAGDVIHVKTTFNASKINIDLLLQTASDAEMGSSTGVASSTGTTGTEQINYTVTTKARYYLKVYAVSGNNAPYTLTVY